MSKRTDNDTRADDVGCIPIIIFGIIFLVGCAVGDGKFGLYVLVFGLGYCWLKSSKLI